MPRLIKLGILLAACGIGGKLSAQPPASKPARAVPGFPAAAKQALEAVTLAEGIEASLFAAEPLLANPVALSVDARGRVYVCETYRVARGVEDNRDHVDWIDDDLAARTVEDRLAFFKKHLDDDLSRYSSYEDRIRLLIDRNGDGKADFARVFADGFKGTLEGIGADVLAWDNQVYYTCIPNLWSLRDTDGDGRADEKDSLHYGFGVRVAFLGHDLHGLCIGPDGRLYFSIGDRGYHIETEDGVVSDPETGAVFRCELDGSRLEVFATGLRNPQDLAFDENGYLFTGDNNSDSGDRARWVYVMEGADSGWRMAYQYISDRGPWNRDRLWEPHHPEQPAYITPPITNFADGPSGLAYYPGTGLPPAYQGNFFLCDFRGQASLSGIRTFKVQPKGATFELIDSEVFAWNCLPTDCDFGPDGFLYATDWIEGWDGTGKGRIHRYAHPASVESKASQEVQTFLAKDVTQFKPAQLTRFLAHPDLRLRRLGQFELARRGQLKALLEVAAKSKIQLARMHAVWGLGQVARAQKKQAPVALAALDRLVQDVDPRIRVIAITLVGDESVATATQKIIDALQDENPQVQYAAAITLGKQGRAAAFGPLVRMISENAETDPALRHAGIMGLTGCAGEDQLAGLRDHADPTVRQAAVVALRRQKSSRIADFLGDDEQRVRGEAIRAIYDVPIKESFAELAEQIETPSHDIEAVRRVLAVHLRLGTEAHAKALANFAANNAHDPTLRAAAVDLLKQWASPPSRDPILGMWRPIKQARDPDTVVTAVRPQLKTLLAADPRVRLAITELAAEFGIQEVEAQLRAGLLDTAADPGERASMMLALGSLKPDGLRELVEQALSDDAPEVRAAARNVLSQIDPEGSVATLIQGFREGSTRERQSAVAVLARLGSPSADNALRVLMQAYLDGSVPPALRLDVMEAVIRRAPRNPELAELLQSAMDKWQPGDRLAPFRDAMHGGDASKGEQLFFERVQFECARCHAVGDRGGKIGPALDAIGDQTRAYLLESIVQPNRTIAKGYESVIYETDDGRVVSGIVQAKTDRQVKLMQSDGTLVTLAQDSIENERRGQSSMPVNLIDKLEPLELRDLIEYLSQLQASE